MLKSVLLVTTGIVIGAGAISVLRAQSGAPYYEVAEIKVTDQPAYEASGVVQLRDTIKTSGAKLIAGGYNKTASYDSTPPANRYLIFMYPDKATHDNVYNNDIKPWSEKVKGKSMAEFRTIGVEAASIPGECLMQTFAFKAANGPVAVGGKYSRPDTWQRASRDVGRRYGISVRHMQDGDVFDAHRLVRIRPRCVAAGQGPILFVTESLGVAAESRRDLRQSQSAAPGMRRFPTLIVIPSARCWPDADHYPSDAAGDALDEQL